MFCSSSRRLPARRWTVSLSALAGVLVASLLLVIAGCASTDSDLPWTDRQPWEGSPMIPGMPAP
jgi:hypothetical protein